MMRSLRQPRASGSRLSMIESRKFKLAAFEQLEDRALLAVITPFTPQFSANATGNIAIVGNTLMTAPASDPNAINAQNGVGPYINNNDFNMAFVDVDNNPSTFDSSQAGLTLPAGSQVLFAGLYWGGRNNTNSSVTDAQRATVMFSTPGSSGYVTLHGAVIGKSNNSNGYDYSSFINVTSQVAAAGSGTYEVANVQADNGTNHYAGWSLVVAYQAPGLPARNLTVFNGYASVDTNSAPTTTSISGFVTPPTGAVNTQVGVVAYEGDRGFTGDSMSLNTTLLGDALNPTNNFFNSTISNLGTYNTNKTPNYNNQLGFDAKVVSGAGILANGSTSATITLSTSQDQYFPSVVTTAIDLYAPQIVAAKTVTDLTRTGPVRPGDILQYTIGVSNTGEDGASNVVLTDGIPANTQYVPNTLVIVSGANAGHKTDQPGDDQANYNSVSNSVVFRLGTGANASVGGTLAIGASTSLTFEVQVNQSTPDQTVINNQATITAVGVTSGFPLTTQSSLATVTVVLPATPTVNTTPNPTNVSLGNTTPPILTDSAVIAGGNSPTGTLSFKLYGPGGVTVVDTETVSVSGNGTYSTLLGYTLPTTGSVAGTYQWVVSYSGDANNNSVTGTLGSEPVTVQSATATIGTNASPSNVTLNSSGPPTLKDSATLTGGFHETGTITFDLYAPLGVVPIHTEIVTVSGNGTYTTPTGYSLPTTGTVAGTYQWVATYSGDGNNSGVASAMGHEPVVVAPANLLLSTTINPSDVTLSNNPLPPVVTDTATLTGSYHATGTITFDLYGPDGVTIVYTDTTPVNGDGTYITTFAPPAPPPGLTIVGTYNWVVSYSGDANNNPVASSFGNESGQVHPANPSLGTSASPARVTLSSGSPPILTDEATLSGGFLETGTITFDLYAPAGVVPIDSESVTVSGNGTYTTPTGYTLPTTGTVTGTYQWVATYSGDGNNIGAASVMGHEPVVVAPATLLMSTTINPSDVTLSNNPLPPVVTDTATLTGSYHATGTITFDLYGPDGVTIVYTDTAPVNGDGTYIATFAPLAPPPPGLPIVGTYNWVVSYSGDANNNSVASSFGNESGQVHPANPSLATDTIPPVVTLSSASQPILTDTATLSGGFEETGTITFDLYAPAGVVPIDTEIVTVSGDGTYTTPTGYTLPTTGTVTGTYQWVATYSGDGNNIGAASVMGHEPVVVAPATLLMSTTINPSDVTLSNNPLPPVVTDTATLTGSYHATGTITFDLYGPDGVTIVYTDTAPVNGDGTYIATFAPLAPPPPGLTIVGTYNWVVSYSGDSNNNAVVSSFGNESGQVHPANPSLATDTILPVVALSSGSPPILTDEATLSGGFLETGTITFDLYAPGGVVPIDTEIVTVSGDGTYTTPTGYTLPTTGTVTGTYQWFATYSGDGNNIGAASTNGDEPVVVAPATLLMSTTINPSDVTLSNEPLPPVVTDSATLTGSYHATGTITFDLYGPDGVTIVYTDTTPVSGDGTYIATFAPTAPPPPGLPIVGTYSWVVSYSGDSNNNPVASPFGNESGQVHPANPSISTNASAGLVTLSSGSPPILTDEATLSGGFLETGTITFDLYAPAGVVPIDTEIVTVSGDGTYATPTGYTLPTTGTVTGTYQWVATYSGDANNIGVASANGDEPVVVAPANLLVSTTSNPTQVTVDTAPFNDSATLSAGFNPSGTMTFTLYAPDGTTAVYTNDVLVTGNGNYSTVTSGDNPGGYIPLVAGTYEWVASYNGDGNNNGVTSSLGDEPVIARTASSILTTSPLPADVTLTSGDSPVLKDSATLTGGLSPTGTITFALFAPDGVTVVDTEVVTVSGNGAYNTPAGYTLPTASPVTGTYQWVASYSGDINNSPDSSALGDEPVQVHAANPSLATDTIPPRVTLSSASPPILTDEATLTGGFSPTGTITFDLYAPGGVVPIDTEIVSASGNGTYTTPTGYTLPTAGTVTGTYQWVATYSGDSNNNAVASANGDEPVVVAPATLLMSTTINPSDVTLSNEPLPPVVTDSATLTGSYHATGTITFDLYGPDGVTIVYTDTTPVNGDGTYITTFAFPAPPPGLPIVGTYNWVVSYSGDSNNNAVVSSFGNESGQVHPANPSISTNASAGLVTLSSGSPPILTDEATLSGGFLETGTITFDLYAPAGVVPIHTEIVTVSGDGTYTTPTGYTLPTTGTVTGTYQWVATYSGDGNNNGAASANGDEPVVVAPATLLMSTTINPSDVTLSNEPLPPVVTDSATLTGSYHATGTITFDLYGPDGVTIVYTDTTPVNGDGTYITTFADPAPPPGLPITGTYNWVVSYSGDSNNNAVVSSFGNESGQVHPANPSIRTNASAGLVTLSSGSPPILTDSATLSGGFLETGTITFDLHAPGGVVPIDTEIVTVSGDGTYTTPTGYTLPTTGTVTGTYQWVATYSGDGNNNAVASANGDEPVVVAPATLLMSTTINPSDVTLSNEPLPPVVTDSATLTGSYHATGTITFDLYGPDGVTIVYTDTTPVSGDGTYIATFAPTAPPPPGLPIVGTYNWVVSYSGDANNNPVVSPFGNESGQVHPANPSLGTSASPARVTLSNTAPPILTDSATLSGGFLETGTITFDLYAPAGVVPIDTEIVTVSGDGTYTTPTGYTLPTTGTVTGTYQWVATYSGDGNNIAVASPQGNEPVVVAPANLLLRTTINPSDVTLSNSPLPPVVTDSATLTGSFHATGTITFDLYGPDGVTIVYTDTTPVNGDGTYTTTFAEPAPPPGLPIVGTYSWVVSYSGDANNNPVASSFGDESGQVHPANPSLGTSASPARVTLSNTAPPILTDEATLSGGFLETGTITFDLYAPAGVVPIDTEIVTVGGDGTYTTPTGYTLPTTGTVTGTYQWVATYSGDGNNIGAASAQGDEPVVVNSATPLITTTTDPTSVTLSDAIVPVLGDTATFSGGYNATGTLTFDLYAPGGVAPVDTEIVTVSGDGTYGTLTGYTLPTTGTVTGTYQWVVTYSGDGNNNGVVSSVGNEPVQVDPANPSLNTTADPSSVTLANTGSPTLTDSATLAGGYNETGTLTFDLYGPDGLTVVQTEIVSVSGDGTYGTPTGYTLPATGSVTGTYQWLVSFSGDGNNNPVASVMGNEPVMVNPASPTVVTTPNPQSVILSGSSPILKDSATLTGGYNETGAISFSLFGPSGESPVFTETVSVSGDGTYTTSSGYTPPTTGSVVGTYQWVVRYNGDANNNGAQRPGERARHGQPGQPEHQHGAEPHRNGAGDRGPPRQCDPLRGLQRDRHDYLHPVRLGPKYGGLLRAGRCSGQHRRQHRHGLGADCRRDVLLGRWLRRRRQQRRG